MLAVTADHYIKVSRFGYIVEIIVVEVQQFGVILKETVLLTCFEEDFFSKPFNSFTRTGNASHQVADIQLYHFRTIPLYGIGHCNYSGYRTVLVHCRSAQSNVPVYWNVVYDKP